MKNYLRVLLFAIGAMLIATFSTINADITKAQEQASGQDEVRELSGAGEDATLLSSLSFPSAMVYASQNCAAAAPVLLVPTEGAISNDLENPRYTWSAVAGVTEYIFQLSLTSDFTQPLVSERRPALAADTQVTHTSFEDLDMGTTYFWRVASVCPDGQIGVSSEPSSFQTDTESGTIPCTLSPPTLLEPADGAQVDTLIPGMVWAKAANVYEYKYERATDDVFTHDVSKTTIIGVRPDQPPTLMETPDDNLTPDTIYFWHVASVCAELDTVGEFSTPFSFRSGPEGGLFPEPPDLISPPDNATTGSIRVTLQFSEETGATGYRIEFYHSQQNAAEGSWFRGLILIRPPGIAVFNPEEILFWRLRARNDYGWGQLSEIRTFSTPVNEAEVTITPDSGGILNPEPGYLTVEFPPNAVDRETALQFHLLASPQQQLPNFRFANRAFSLTASSGQEQISSFSKPFTMTIEYNESDLAAVGISDPAQLNVVFWNGNAWEELLPCNGCVVDTVGRTVTVVLDHLTEFALVAPGLDDVPIYLPLIQP